MFLIGQFLEEEKKTKLKIVIKIITLSRKTSK